MFRGMIETHLESSLYWRDMNVYSPHATMGEYNLPSGLTTARGVISGYKLTPTNGIIINMKDNQFR